MIDIELPIVEFTGSIIIISGSTVHDFIKAKHVLQFDVVGQLITDIQLGSITLKLFSIQTIGACTDVGTINVTRKDALIIGIHGGLACVVKPIERRGGILSTIKIAIVNARSVILSLDHRTGYRVGKRVNRR